MKRLGKDIDALIAQLSGNEDQARINYRAHQVRGRYRQAMEAVYKDQAQLFLDHTNNVFIMDKEGVKTLIVYVDESIFAAELNAQRELIKLKLLELSGEDIEDFIITVSKPRYKDNHPFTTADSQDNPKKAKRKPLSDEQRAYVKSVAGIVEDDTLRQRIEEAMTADLEWNSGEDVKSS